MGGHRAAAAAGGWLLTCRAAEAGPGEDEGWCGSAGSVRSST